MVSNSGMMLSAQRGSSPGHQQAGLLEQQRHLQHVAGRGGHRDDVVRDRARAEAGVHAARPPPASPAPRSSRRCSVTCGDTSGRGVHELAQQQLLALRLGQRLVAVAARSRARAARARRARGRRCAGADPAAPGETRTRSTARSRLRSRPSAASAAPSPPARGRSTSRSASSSGGRRRTARAGADGGAPSVPRRRPARAPSPRRARRCPTSARRNGSSSRLVPRSGERAASACSSGDIVGVARRQRQLAAQRVNLAPGSARRSTDACRSSARAGHRRAVTCGLPSRSPPIQLATRRNGASRVARPEPSSISA